MKNTKKMPSFEGIPSGGVAGTATLRMPIGVTYHNLLVTYSGVTLAQMNEIRVIGNGKTFQRYSVGTVVDTMNQHNKRAAASGVISLDFTRHNLNTRTMEELTAIGTGFKTEEVGSEQLSTLSVEIDIDAAALGAVLSAKALVTPKQPLGLIRHVREYVYTASAVGEMEISDIPKGHLFNRVFFRNANVTALRIERDGYTAFERTAAENSLIQTDGKRTPQAGNFVFDPTELGHGMETFETAGVQDLRFIPTMSATGQVPVVVESIAPLK